MGLNSECREYAGAYAGGRKIQKKVGDLANRLQGNAARRCNRGEDRKQVSGVR